MPNVDCMLTPEHIDALAHVKPDLIEQAVKLLKLSRSEAGTARTIFDEISSLESRSDSYKLSLMNQCTGVGNFTQQQLITPWTC